MCACPVLRVLRTETQCRWEVSPLQGICCQGDQVGRSCEHAPSVSLLCCSLCFRVTRARGAAREDQRSNGRLVNKGRQAREAGWGAWAEVVDRATAVLCPCPPLPLSFTFQCSWASSLAQQREGLALEPRKGNISQSGEETESLCSAWNTIT